MHNMKKLIPILAIIMALYATSCNEKPKHYTFVKNLAGGKQVVENIDATNDTVALNLYLDRMSQVIVAAMTDSTSEDSQIESMYVISPDGDTLNTNKELMKVIEQQVVEKSKRVVNQKQQAISLKPQQDQ